MKLWKTEYWIFNAQEPIAHLKLDSAELKEMKLVPGGPPQLKTSLTWLECDQRPSQPATLRSVKTEAHGEELILIVTGKTLCPKASTRNEIRIRYEAPLKSYIYEFNGSSTLDPKDPIKLKSIEFNYLFPLYPALTESAYPWEFFWGENAKLYRSPIRNDWDQNPLSQSLRPYYFKTPFQLSQKAGHFLVRGPHPIANPAVEFLHDEIPSRSSCATCAYSHETHLGWERNANQIYKAHYRYLGYNPEKMQSLLKKATLFAPKPPEPNIRVLQKPGINHFEKDQHVSAKTPVFSKTCAGTYQVIQQEGPIENFVLLLENHDWIRFNADPNRFWNQLHFQALFQKKTTDERLTIHAFQGDLVERKSIRPSTKSWFEVDIPLSFSEGNEGGTVEIYYEGHNKVWLDNLEIKERSQLGILDSPFRRIISRMNLRGLFNLFP